MRKSTILFCVLMVFFTLSLYAGEWTGYIADTSCAVKKGEDPGHAGCAKKCIGGGADAVLASGGKVFKLDNQENAKKFAGQKVLLKGTLSEDGVSIAVKSIAQADN